MYKTVFGKIDLTRDAVFADIVQFYLDVGWTDEYTYDDSLATAFQPSHAYSLGDIMCPATKNGWVYICDTPGTSAASAPSYSTSAYGQRVTSNTAKFIAIPNGRVFSSCGESGTGEKLYFFITKVMRAGAIDAMCAMYLDATTHILRHTSGRGASATNTTYRLVLGTQESAQNLYFYGDKDMVSIHTRNGVTSLGGWVCMRGDEPLVQHKTLLTAQCTTGTNITLTVSSSVAFFVGEWIQVVHALGNGKRTARITSIPDATHIVVDRMYSAMPVSSIVYDIPPILGAWDFNSLSMNFIPPGSTSGGIYVLSSDGYRYDNLYVDGDTTDEYFRVWKNVNYQGAFEAEQFATLGHNSFTYAKTPSGRFIYPYIASHFYQGDSEVGTGNSYGSGIIPIKGNIRGNVQASWLDIYLINPTQVSALLTSATATTAVDTTQSWATNALVDKIIAITNGAGAGQTRRISSNDATSVTVDIAWATNPDNTSTYIIVEQAYRCMGNNWGLKEVVR